jgi:hypothetical protein
MKIIANSRGISHCGLLKIPKIQLFRITQLKKIPGISDCGLMKIPGISDCGLMKIPGIRTVV